jgi:hypothetical protein
MIIILGLPLFQLLNMSLPDNKLNDFLNKESLYVPQERSGVKSYDWHGQASFFDLVATF